jgi:hypothetical protein
VGAETQEMRVKEGGEKPLDGGGDLSHAGRLHLK